MDRRFQAHLLYLEGSVDALVEHIVALDSICVPILVAVVIAWMILVTPHSQYVGIPLLSPLL